MCLPSLIKGGDVGTKKGWEKAVGKAKIHKVMSEYKEGMLRSGSKKGPMVTSRRQAIAIALNESKRAMKKRKKKRS